jgi:hypothetical protein
MEITDQDLNLVSSEYSAECYAFNRDVHLYLFIVYLTTL